MKKLQKKGRVTEQTIRERKNRGNEQMTRERKGRGKLTNYK